MKSTAASQLFLSFRSSCMQQMGRWIHNFQSASALLHMWPARKSPCLPTQALQWIVWLYGIYSFLIIRNYCYFTCTLFPALHLKGQFLLLCSYMLLLHVICIATHIVTCFAACILKGLFSPWSQTRHCWKCQSISLCRWQIWNENKWSY